MTSRKRLSAHDLHAKLVDSMGDTVVRHSDMGEKPLELDLEPPLPSRVRAYVYNATNPPGGRTVGECKCQLIVPGQKSGESGFRPLSISSILCRLP